MEDPATPTKTEKVSFIEKEETDVLSLQRKRNDTSNDYESFRRHVLKNIRKIPLQDTAGLVVRYIESWLREGVNNLFCRRELTIALRSLTKIVAAVWPRASK